VVKKKAHLPTKECSGAGIDKHQGRGEDIDVVKYDLFLLKAMVGSGRVGRCNM
jgi:hypothetical protein